MAERRMFSKKITESDVFLDMPLSAQALYLHLNMTADDDGFVNNPRRTQRAIGAADDDLRLLLAKGFIISFDTGVIVVTHWRVHNTVRKDRYTETLYAKERGMLTLENDHVYRISGDGIPSGNQVATKWQPSGNHLETQYRIDKDKEYKDKSLYSCADQSDEEEKAEKKEKEPDADVEAIPLNTGEEWRPSVSEYEEFCRLYPGVNVRIEIAKMRGWCLSNPTRRKTKSGVKRFVNSWLSKEQDRSKSATAPSQYQKNSFNRIPQQEYDMSALKERLVSNR